MITLLHYNAQGTTIQLGQLELQVLMRFVHEGRAALSCNNDLGESMDQFFVSANILVEEERRAVVQREMSMRKTSSSACSAQLKQTAGLPLLPITTGNY